MDRRQENSLGQEEDGHLLISNNVGIALFATCCEGGKMALPPPSMLGGQWGEGREGGCPLGGGREEGWVGRLGALPLLPSPHGVPPPPPSFLLVKTSKWQKETNYPSSLPSWRIPAFLAFGCRAISWAGAFVIMVFKEGEAFFSFLLLLSLQDTR